MTVSLPLASGRDADVVAVRTRLGPYGADRVAEVAALIRAGATG
ncbi:hypothetical protein Q3W71_22485 [Micromonospora sp. C28SCA-DRY-2]|nr:hypothetical protein [Micromonospora sp. C28SCA-DRY-2]MDO3704436.1 hypothetical protein [Micromonospora sp. C28SCA-DRY-2]